MHVIQVQVTTRQERGLRELATLRGSSISNVIREGIDRVLESALRERNVALDRARMVIGAFDSGSTDVSERHDAHLADTYRNEPAIE